MAGARQPAPALVVLVLTGLAAAGEPETIRRDRAVGVLLGVLLCLAVGLAVAWRHLCRLSAGRYHPRPMGHRVLGLLRGRWHRLRGGRGDPPEDPGHREVAEDPREEEEAEEEEELMPWSQDHRPKEEEEEEEEAAPEAGESPPGGEQEVGGSAEALLSDLHAFSGTAAWGDTRGAATAL
ncbi:protein tyrosine phosphatase receptor type C-associated protein [Tyto alba]|uniref:protein tyrosine phosphatase receptor type C-associated protein n=1 Tax=Tyto alba TaxID=56313 RepID=UPI001C6691CB|nr:protein tyrosine phosphatase receptor type C-associated protein [Tyto alba]